MKMEKRLINNLVTFALVTLAYIIITILINTGGISNLLKGLLIPTCSYILAALALNLTVGVLGELSLGHAGFMSVGAFGAIIINGLLNSLGLPVILRIVISILVGAILAGIFGAIVGLPVLRLQGDYLAIVTLAFGEIIKSIVTNLYVGFDSKGLHFSLLENKFNLEEGGQMLVNGPMGGYGSKCASFTLAFILIMLVLLVIFNLVHSKAGRAIMAFRDNKIAAESIGINISYYKLMTFILSAVIAGVAGALYGLNSTSLSASKFDYNTSILLLVFVVLGGLGNMRGTIVAAAILNVLPELLRPIKDYRMLIYAVLLIVIMLITNNAKINVSINTFIHRLKKLRKKGNTEVSGNE